MKIGNNETLDTLKSNGAGKNCLVGEGNKMEEKFVKFDGYQSRVASMRAELKKARKIVVEARRLAKKTAYCCEASLDSLISEIDHNIGTLEMHLKKGLLEGDVVDL